jgi:hypothetical protein
MVISESLNLKIVDGRLLKVNVYGKIRMLEAFWQRTGKV